MVSQVVVAVRVVDETEVPLVACHLWLNHQKKNGTIAQVASCSAHLDALRVGDDCGSAVRLRDRKRHQVLEIILCRCTARGDPTVNSEGCFRITRQVAAGSDPLAVLNEKWIIVQFGWSDHETRGEVH